MGQMGFKWRIHGHLYQTEGDSEWQHRMTLCLEKSCHNFVIILVLI